MGFLTNRRDSNVAVVMVKSGPAGIITYKEAIGEAVSPSASVALHGYVLSSSNGTKNYDDCGFVSYVSSGFYHKTHVATYRILTFVCFLSSPLRRSGLG